MNPTAKLDEEFNRRMARAFLNQKLKKYPLPWTVDNDWTSQIVDASGNVVHEFPATDAWLSSKFIEEAEKLNQENIEGDKEFEEMMRELEENDKP